MMNIFSKLFKSKESNPIDIISQLQEKEESQQAMPSDDTYTHKMQYNIGADFFSLKEEDIPFTLTEWLVPANGKVMKGEKIIRYTIASYKGQAVQKLFFETAEISGVLLHLLEEGQTVQQGIPVYAIKPAEISKRDINSRIESSQLKSKDITFQSSEYRVFTFQFYHASAAQIVNMIDSFDGDTFKTNEYTLYSMTGYEVYRLSIYFRREKYFIRLKGHKKHFLMNPQEQLELLLENNEIMTLFFTNTPTSIDKDSEGIIIQNDIEISVTQLDELLHNTYINWSLKSVQKQREIRGKNLSEQELIEFHKSIKTSIIALRNI